jgi:hypothetical protein
MEQLELATVSDQWMRLELRSDIETLIDDKYLPVNWAEDSRLIDGDLEIAIKFFLDDAELDKHSEESVGFFLMNIEEATLLRDITIAILGVVKDVGPEAPTRAYVTAPGWRNVVALAKLAKELIALNDASFAQQQSAPNAPIEAGSL